MELIGHRGAPARAPENTLASFRAALHAGVDAIESDVRATSDGALVLMHDDDVSRTTGARGRISQMTLREVRTLDAGDGERVPAIEEILTLGVRLVLEVKGSIVDGEYRSATPVARATVAAIGDRTDIVVSSFDPGAVAEVRALAPLIVTALGVLPGAPLEWAIDAAVEAGHAGCHVAQEDVTSSFVEHAHASGLRVLAFTVNEPARARALRLMGVDGIFSDDPAAMRAVLDEHT